jgi:hypothetical protein
MRDMRLDRCLRHHERSGDLGVGESRGQQFV